ncbi:YheC/YheD family protein [Bacillus lacus]|uniref:YheC/YheD family protein n=1 Tax=Metabacillus lacus TaxID=1983721 RepID=A0A7X2IXH7_9BACI|nr:YheC/YheD family protein [Metabacillus lacus]MRX71489.1 YheC/YheD family protein [Metabacillus lacus]
MKIVLGFMTVHPDHERIHAAEIAKRANSHGVKLVRFCPEGIQPDSHLVNGEEYNAEEAVWTSSSFPIPPYIYDRCFYKRDSCSKKAKPIVEWLKNKPGITFLGKGLPNKFEVYSSLKQDRDLAPYLPYTAEVKRSSDVTPFLLKERSCLLKPQHGSRGQGVMAVSLDRKSISVSYHAGKEKKVKSFRSLEEFEKWLSAILSSSSSPYLLQPLLNLSDRRGYPFDVRILLQKDGTGGWVQRGISVRRGYQHSYLSNLYAGGEPVSYQEWISSYSANQRYLIEDDLKTILQSLTKTLDEKHSPLFEAGIDIGIAANQSMWILDINSKPGRKAILETLPDMAEDLYHAPAIYCKYLFSTKQGAEDNNETLLIQSDSDR